MITSKIKMNIVNVNEYLPYKLLCYTNEIVSINVHLYPKQIENILYGTSMIDHSGWLGKVCYSKLKNYENCNLNQLTCTEIENLNRIYNECYMNIWIPLIHIIIEVIQRDGFIRTCTLYKQFGFKTLDEMCGLYSKQFIAWNFLHTLVHHNILEKINNKFILKNVKIPKHLWTFKKPHNIYKSIGEQMVNDILTNMSVKFQTQTNGPVCKKKCKFDFCIYWSNNRIGYIEVDGIQHHKLIEHWHGIHKNAIHNFLNAHIRDKIKNMYCIENKISLLRIRDNSKNFDKKIKKWVLSDNRSIEFEYIFRIPF